MACLENCIRAKSNMVLHVIYQTSTEIFQAVESFGLAKQTLKCK